MSVTIQSRGDTAANWTAADPVLHQREIGVETDTFKAKIGDGVTAWASLPYWTLGTLAVMSVFGRHGAVTAQAGDYTAAQVGALALGGGNMLGWLGPKEVTLAQSSGSVAIDAEAGNSFVLPLTASGWTIEAPVNPQPGQLTVWVGQDPSGSRTVAWAAGWNFGQGAAPVLSTTPGAWDLCGFKWNAALGQYCFIGMEPGFAPPPQDIAWSDGVSSAPTSGDSVSLVLPGDLQAGDQVVIGVCANGAAGFTASSTGPSVPSQFGAYRTGQFASISGLFGFTVQPGDLNVGGGTATITFTSTGGTSPCTPAAALGAWSGAVLPPGAVASSASTVTAGTYAAPAAVTVANQSWSAEFAMLPDNAFLTTTVPAGLTGRTLGTHQVVIADSNGPVGAAGTPIGGDTWASGASVVWHAWTIALNPV